MKNKLAILVSLLAFRCNSNVTDTERAKPKEQLMQRQFYDAAVFGDIAIVRALIKSNPELVNSADKYGFTALHGVAGEEHYEVAKLLVANGADVNAENDEGITPLHSAANPQMIKLLAKLGGNINHRARDGSTPLHTNAANFEGLDCIIASLELGADPNIRDNDNQTPADIAGSREEHDKVKLLTITKQ